MGQTKKKTQTNHVNGKGVKSKVTPEKKKKKKKTTPKKIKKSSSTQTTENKSGSVQARKYLPLLHTLKDTPTSPRRDLLSRLHPQCLSYIITTLTHILLKKRGYHVSEREAQRVRAVLKPHATKQAFKLITQPNKGKQIQQQIYKQNGRGIFLSALLSAAIPLIASVIRRFQNNK